MKQTKKSFPGALFIYLFWWGKEPPPPPPPPPLSYLMFGNIKELVFHFYLGNNMIPTSLPYFSLISLPLLHPCSQRERRGQKSNKRTTSKFISHRCNSNRASIFEIGLGVWAFLKLFIILHYRDYVFSLSENKSWCNCLEHSVAPIRDEN